jgi:hypothetical protein
MNLNLRGFQKPTSPNLFENQISPNINNANRNIPKEYYTSNKITEPIMDIRYPGRVAPMEDGRFVTDYRPKCTQNIHPQNQFSTKLWMIHHADELINLSRQRQAEWSGASCKTINTVPPPENISSCNAFNCTMEATNYPDGIGIERVGSACPSLFGTFTPQQTGFEMNSCDLKNIPLTRKYEGGRNTPRG